MERVIEKVGTSYNIVCPECDTSLFYQEENEMPWCEDDEEWYTCPNCKIEFKVAPKYEFKGFTADSLC